MVCGQENKFINKKQKEFCDSSLPVSIPFFGFANYLRYWLRLLCHFFVSTLHFCFTVKRLMKQLSAMSMHCCTNSTRKCQKINPLNRSNTLIPILNYKVIYTSKFGDRPIAGYLSVMRMTDLAIKNGKTTKKLFNIDLTLYRGFLFKT